MQVKDQAMKSMQQKHEVEATAKARAQSAVGTHLESLAQCMRLVSVLQSEVSGYTETTCLSQHDSAAVAQWFRSGVIGSDAAETQQEGQYKQCAHST